MGILWFDCFETICRESDTGSGSEKGPQNSLRTDLSRPSVLRRAHYERTVRPVMSTAARLNSKRGEKPPRSFTLYRSATRHTGSSSSARCVRHATAGYDLLAFG